MRRHIVISLAGLIVMATGVRFLAQTPVKVIKADLIETRFVKATDRAPSIIRQGTYWFTRDGRQRSEWTANGVTTAEITRSAEGKDIVLNLQTRQATAGTTAMPMIPMLPGGGNVQRGEQTRRDLGTKTVGNLTLRGMAFITPTSAGTETFEFWDYRINDPHVIPVILERRIDAPDEVLDMRVVGMTETTVDQSLFEIPAGYSQQGAK